MNAHIKDLTHRGGYANSGKIRYFEYRSQGYSRELSARGARISLDYAANLEADHRQAADHAPPCAEYETEERHVAALIEAGGYARLSEKLTRRGHVACLPLISFGARP